MLNSSNPNHSVYKLNEKGEINDSQYILFVTDLRK